ncbi:MAG: branched-chain amino acid transaminase [Patescibacteria group bacterium]
MQTTEIIWFNGNFIPWEKAQTHVLTHALHYGTGVFEGIRVYDTARGPAIFHLDKHVERFCYSAKTLAMKLPYSMEQIKQAIIDTVRKNKVRACYIRPIAYYEYQELKVLPIKCPIGVAIAVWPWGAYLSEGSVRIKIIEDIPLSKRGKLTSAKITGHYNNLMYAAHQAVSSGYHEALLLDTAGNIAEGPGENFFMVKDGVIITPELGYILPGITRATIIKIAQNLSFSVIERKINRKEVFAADECFFTGTAAEVTPIGSIDDRQIKESFGPVTKKIKDIFNLIIRGENAQYDTWLTYV